uniref:SWIB/MDM2 domain protein n=1 Tax=Iridovirus LCIVAC01 TaxID=2506607 RepID=A0A481YRR4_9VIRU|nr:MAG: SWIB/MDM2 domain protein [Iridovirus LCIVAC01]
MSETENKDNEPDLCCICYDSIDSAPTMQLSCKHILHTECGLGWIIEKKTCPLCRQETLAKKYLPHAEDAPAPSVRSTPTSPPAPASSARSSPAPVKRKVKRKHRRRRPVKIEKENRPKDSGSTGFMEPVRISAEMAKFIGCYPDELRSRLNITKCICDYIKDNNLQNPCDRREIFVDDRLRKLFHFHYQDGKPLTHYTLQKHIMKHFSRG